MDTLEEYEHHLRSKGIDPYKEIKLQTDNLQDKKQQLNHTDTDTPEQRFVRLNNQQGLEERLYEMFGQSLVERSTNVREGVFGESDVRGDPAIQIRQRSAATGKGETRFYYPDKIRMAEKYFPDLVKFVDGLYEDLSNTPNLSQDQILRFCAVVYDMGILVHPYIDGNGQTFRIVAESYLHELSSESEGKYFPFRVSQNPTSRIRSVHTELMDHLPSSPDVSPLQDLVTVQEFLKTMPTNDGETTMPTDFTEWLQEVKEYLDNPSLTAESSIGVLKSKLEEEAKKLKRLGIDGEVINGFTDAQKAFERQRLAHGYLDYTLEDPNSREMHLNYILNGNLEGNSVEIEHQAYSQMAFFTHNRTFSQMKNVLQNGKEHQIDFENAIAKLKKT